MAKAIDTSWLKDWLVKMSDALEVIEEAGKAKTELSALKAEMARLEKDRDKLVDGLKKQAEVEAKATADQIVSEARATAKKAIEQAHADADAHYQTVKEQGKRAVDQAMAAVREKHAELDALDAKCAEAQADLDDIHREHDETVAKMRSLAEKFAA